MTETAPARRIGVIMAGGSGERFWPLSRRRRPKQLLRLSGTDRTLLAEAVERLAPLIPPERLLVATAAHLQEAIRAAGLVPPENVLAEPCKRNTAGCLVWVAAHCLARYGAEEICLATVTADHRIGAPARFRAVVDAALSAAEAEPVLATVGVQPTRPETGYGYIEVAATLPTAAEGAPPPVLPVVRFREKPNRATAEDFVASGRFYWNSGMFFWRLGTFLAELEQARPEMAAATRDLAELLRAGDDAGAGERFAALEDISVDYALMEQARRVVMVPGDFPWDDVGAWDALARILPADGRGNVAVGDPVLVEARDCVVYNEPGAQAVAVGVVGVEGLVVVVSGDAVLVVPRQRCQDVRQIVARLKERDASQV